MLKSVKEAEAEASTGTSARKAHVSSGISFPVSKEAIQALSNLKSGGFVNLVQLVSYIPQASACAVSAYPLFWERLSTPRERR